MPKAFREGFNAFERGQNLDHNPYSHATGFESEQASLWEAGWVEAQEQLEEMEAQ